MISLITLIFLHGGPGLPEYLEPYLKDQFQAPIQTIFYQQKQMGVKFKR